MAEDTIKKSGTKPSFKDDRGGGVLIPHPVIGVVKDNIDTTHSGRIRVYIARFGGSDPSDPKQWRTVKYLSPWFGTIAPNFDVYDGPDKTGTGKYVGNPHSYGFWATAPDIGSNVICIFVDGNPQDGYYVGCVPYPGLTHMVPAIGAAKLTVPNTGEARTYGGADRLPVTEVNYSNPSIRNSPKIYSEAKPVHTYQAGILAQQGLIRDNVRGVIGSSSQRETPSRVFGISTPGQAIYEGGYTSATIDQAAKTVNTDKLQIVGRTGGHSIVMDDGKLNGEDQLMRFRTAAGHMLMMSDSGQVLTIIHSNGQSYIELGKEGTVDIYSSNSINLRSQGDLNFHADRDINMHAKRNFNIFSDNIKLEADQNITHRTGKDFTGYYMGKYEVKVDNQMSFASSGNSSFLSSSVTYINGNKINLNTGYSATVPGKVAQIVKIKHIDTTFSQSKTWMHPSPDPLLSVTSRTPAHMPWAEANKGVDVSTGAAQPVSPPQPTPSVQAANAAAPATPATPITPSVAATAPSQPQIAQGDTTQLPPPTTTALVSQQAVNGANTSTDDKLKQGIAPGAAGATLGQLSAAGQVMKPGSGDFVKALQQQAPGLPLSQVASKVVMTGASGVTDAVSLVKNTAAQVGAVTNALQTATKGLTNSGVLTGKESPTQVAGVIFAAANNGVAAVTNLLKAPAAIAANLGGAISGIGKSISSGNFAAGLADKLSSGLSGVASSLGGMAAGALGSLSSGISNFLGKSAGGIESLISGLAGAARNAFNVAEKSFGELKAGVPNLLGGGVAATEPVLSKTITLVRDRSAALDEYSAATKELIQAKRAYRVEESSETYEALQSAEARFAAAEQRNEQTRNQLDSAISDSSASNTKSSNNLFGNIGAQKLSTLAAAAASGMLTAPSSKNTGLNALPGGIGAFVNQISSSASNAASSIKSMASALADPAKLVGNLVSNVQKSIGALGASVTQKLGSITSAITNPLTTAGNLISNPLAAAGNLLSGAKESVTGLISNVTSMFGSIGNAPGQVKQAVLATETFAARAAINSKIGELLGDSRIPLPVFETIEVKITPDEYQQAQVDAQQNISELLAEREVKSYELDSLSVVYAETGEPGTLEQINTLTAEILNLDILIEDAQGKFNDLITNG